MKQRTRIPRRRQQPRRKRPELFFKPESNGKAPWRVISLWIRHSWWALGILRCALCGLVIKRFEDLVPDHKEPGKMGGCKDNSVTNLQPAHWWCNLEKGSKRIA